ncbi:MAG: 3-phosphoserine/phosphohydroxythreonine transaminase [Gemmataceae bacterium]
MSMIHNFNAGPAMLPPAVLDRVHETWRDFAGPGLSILEISHRSREFESLIQQAETRLKRLLSLGDNYRVLFLQGGASLQFAMIPLNFLNSGRPADYLVTGSWGEKAVEEARPLGQVRVVSTGPTYDHVPESVPWFNDAAYVHLTTNETIQGVQWHTIPEVGSVPLLADMSSDLLSRPVDAGRFALIYAGAQKNLGPAGVTVVILREEMLERANRAVPTMLRYQTHVQHHSLYNTPPVFSIFVLESVLEWIEQNGGAVGMHERNEAKAHTLYEVIDAGYYRGHAQPQARSRMNVTFRLPSPEAEKQFLSEAAQHGMIGLAGHRSVGGIRASLYNAVPLSSCRALAEFMRDFARRHG